MNQTVVKYTDINGKAGNIRLDGNAASDSLLNAHFIPLTYLAVTGISQVTEQATAAITKAAPDGAATLAENTKYYKCFLTFKGKTSGEIYRWTIPAPKINVDGGIIALNTPNGGFYVPAKKASGTGKDGAELATSYKTLIGASEDLVFLSGTFGKQPR
jgi:hypothetical protein